MELVDTHVHLADDRFAPDLFEVLSRARAAGVVQLVCVGYDIGSSAEAIRLSATYPDIFAAVGIHPNRSSDAVPGAMCELDRLSQSSRVVAIGECGLDYFRNDAPPEVQREAFIAQLRLADTRGLPVIVHSRDAMSETLELLEEFTPRCHGVLHCFDGTVADASRAIALGFCISAAGQVTYRRDRTLADALASVPADRLVIETDCPYLSPAGHRGERNEPSRVLLVANAVANIRGCSVEELAAQTTANARRLFGIA
ncbi:MAG: TatD family deoxyribonuclease [Chloroflexi bacterium]|nr:TatD family deoxyribonuclease [Chloroflexota bacterium]